MHADAESAGVWVNSADDRAHSSFILPAVHRDGPVTVAVSTGGLSPALSPPGCGTVWRPSAARGSATLASCSARHGSVSGAAGARSDSVDWAALLDGPLLERVRPVTWTTHGQL